MNWAENSVFLTGHTGFKGAWLTHWLLELGVNVTGYSLAPLMQNNLFDQLELTKKIHHIVGDVRNFDLLKRSIATAKPDFVFHLAAQSLVRSSYENPLDTWSTNAMGTVHILDALRQLDSQSSLVAVTTDKVYLNRETTKPYSEEDRLGGHDPYSASKAACELAISSYRASFPQSPTKIASARAGNVIGGGDWARDRLVPDIVRHLSLGEDILVRNPNSVRPWQHVLDPLAGYLSLAEFLHTNEKSPELHSFNFGPDESGNRTVSDVIKSALSHWPGRFVDVSNSADHHEANLLSLSTSRAKAILGWKPIWHFETAIEKTIQWYRMANEGADAKELCTEQLSQFRRLNGS